MKENIIEGMELSPKDNYYLYVNYDFHMDMKNGGKKKNTSKDNRYGVYLIIFPKVGQPVLKALVFKLGMLFPYIVYYRHDQGPFL